MTRASASSRCAASRFRTNPSVAILGLVRKLRGRRTFNAPASAPGPHDTLPSRHRFRSLVRRRSSPMDRPEILMAPGPTPVPPEVLLAQGSPLVYHRGPGYGNLLREVTRDLQRLYRTSGDVLIFSSSGTGGLESAVANLFSPGDRVVVPVAGYFGQRFAGIARAFGLDVRTVDYEWGRAAVPEDIAAAVAEAPTKGVLAQHSETSTGVVHDIEAIGHVTREA